VKTWSNRISVAWGGSKAERNRRKIIRRAKFQQTSNLREKLWQSLPDDEMIREAGGVQSGAKKARRLKDRLRTLSLSLSLSPPSNWTHPGRVGFEIRPNLPLRHGPSHLGTRRVIPPVLSM